jgi:hypothetical protein
MLAIVSVVALLLIPLGVWEGRKRRSYQRAVAGWAEKRGWTFSADRKGPDWTVEGAYEGRSFTLGYSREGYSNGVWIGTADTTNLVIDLANDYGAARVVRRSGLRHRVVPLGHAAFDKKFQVRTDARGGPAAMVPQRLAEAHAAGQVPLWSLDGRSLTCHVGAQIQVRGLDEAVQRAARVAELLGVR